MRMWWSGIGLLLLAACRPAASPAPTFEAPSIPRITPEIEVGTRDLAQTMLDMVNDERCQRELPPLILNDILSDVALQHSKAMAEQGFFDHINPETGLSPGDRVLAAGYGYAKVGENIAAGQLRPEEVHMGWMDSLLHRDNILDPAFQEMGLGYVQAPGSEFGFYWTQVFGTQLALQENPRSVSCDG